MAVFKEFVESDRLPEPEARAPGELKRAISKGSTRSAAVTHTKIKVRSVNNLNLLFLGIILGIVLTISIIVGIFLH